MKKLTLIVSVFILGLLSSLPAEAEILEVIPVTAEESSVEVTKSIASSKPPCHYRIKSKYRRPDYWIIDYDRYSPRSNVQTPKRWDWCNGHWAGVGIYYNGLVQNIGNLTLPSGAEYMNQSPKSIGVNINVIDFTLVSNKHFGLITGLGFEINNFRFDNNIGLIEDQNGVVGPDYSYDVQGLNLSKSKLTTVYMNIPLLVEFQFGRSRNSGRGRGFVNFGAIAGVRLQGHTKVQYKDQDGGNQTTKKHSGLNLRNFHYGAEFNIGYCGFALSARYYPQSIFKANGGPEVQQVNIGLSFMF